MANVINIIVLTRRTMLLNATNIILCGLSCAQLILLVSFLGRTIYTYIDLPCAYDTKAYMYLVIMWSLVNSVCVPIIMGEGIMDDTS